MGLKNKNEIVKACALGGLMIGMFSTMLSLPVYWHNATMAINKATNSEKELRNKLNNEIHAEESFRARWDREKKVLLEKLGNEEITTEDYARAFREYTSEESYWDFVSRQ